MEHTSCAFQSAEIGELVQAMAVVQGTVASVGKDKKNEFLNTRYATLGAVISAVRPVALENGLVIIQSVIGTGDENVVGVRTTIAHKSGQWMTSDAYMQIGVEKGKSAAQVAGSIVSYLRRYAIASSFCLYTDEDTDGTLPAGREGQRAGANGANNTKATNGTNGANGANAAKLTLPTALQDSADNIKALPWARAFLPALSQTFTYPALPENEVAEVQARLDALTKVVELGRGMFGQQVEAKLTDYFKTKGMRNHPIELELETLNEAHKRLTAKRAEAAAKAAA